MEEKIKKIYKKLSKHDNFSIAHEASLQLKFESGKNSEEQKEIARLKSMVELIGLMTFEIQKNNPKLKELTINSFINAFEKLK